MSGLDTIRTDVVGSLLRPDAVKKARADWDAGKIDLAERTRIEDEAVREAIKLQVTTRGVRWRGSRAARQSPGGRVAAHESRTCRRRCDRIAPAPSAGRIAQAVKPASGANL